VKALQKHQVKPETLQYAFALDLTFMGGSEGSPLYTT